MIKKLLIIALFSTALYGCSFLDFDESTGMPKEEVLAYIQHIEDLGNAVYNDIPDHYSPIDGAMRESATDNSLYTLESNAINDIYANKWSPINTIDTKWSSYYEGIRKANFYFENYSKEKIERFENSLGYDQDLIRLEMLVNELHVLRAYFHFELAIRYGSIPIIKRTYKMNEVNSITKSSFQDVIAFIVTECDEYGTKLPINHSSLNGDTGRATKGFAMALKARALLYAASPLHNPTNDRTLWEAAAKASDDVIKSGMYSMPNITEDKLYSKDGGHDVLSSQQLIFECRGGESNSFEARNLPFGMEGAETGGGNTPTQNFVDAFEIKISGTYVKFDWTNSEHRKNIYYDAAGNPTRDPRFYHNVICNGMEYMEVPVQTFDGGEHRKALEGYTKTGYYLKKLMNETVDLDPSNDVEKYHHYPLFRYAEVLLNHAEAMNEWQGNSSSNGGLTLSALEALNQVRTAANMPIITDGSGFTAKLRNERNIELAFENHRFWDIRRWKIGSVVEDIYGIRITTVGANTTYTRELVQSRVWDNKMHLYPIPQDEIYMNNNLLPQNGGW